MEKIIDRIIIYILSIIAMYNLIHGNYLIVTIYSSMAFSAINLYLLDVRKRDLIETPKGYKELIAFVLQIVALLLVIMNPRFCGLLPIVLYDVYSSRNVFAYVIYLPTIISVIMMIFEDENLVNKSTIISVIYTFILCVLSIYMVIKTEKNERLNTAYKSIRDNFIINEEELIKKNRELINAKDSEVYAAQLSERNRIAREIHDNVGHMLSRAILQMGAMLSIYKEDPLNSQLEDIRKTLDGAMNSIRSSVHDLHNESLNLDLQIRNMVKDLEGKYKVSLEIDVEDDMPRNLKYVIIGVVKEGVSNIIKHSDNTNVDIRLVSHPVLYQLVIHDYDVNELNDKSININANTSKDNNSDKKNMEEYNNNKDIGMGLYNIRSRVESVGGIVNITNNDGFRIFITIPKSKKEN